MDTRAGRKCDGRIKDEGGFEDFPSVAVMPWLIRSATRWFAALTGMRPQTTPMIIKDIPVTFTLTADGGLGLDDVRSRFLVAPAGVDDQRRVALDQRVVEAVVVGGEQHSVGGV